MKVAFATLGCKVNQYDTDAMRELFEKAGHEVVPFEAPADVYVVNTCTVTAVGDKKSRQMIARAHALAPDAAVIVAGCFAQSAPEEAAALPGVAAVAGTKERADIVRIAEEALRGIRKTDVAQYHGKTCFEALDVSREGRTRAYLKIQDGCDRYCTYCIIPYARGPVRSRPLDDVRRQLETLDAEEYHEVVFTGIHLMSYGKDMAQGSLTDAIALANDLDNIKRIRLGSLEPQLLRDDFVRALAQNAKVCRQFHLSLQSGSAGVLSRMARRYTPDDYRACVASLRAAMPGCAITTDIIAGFPGETEDEFIETLDFAKEIGFARIHVFPYSRRRGTKAYDMPDQVPFEVKKERAAKLIALGKTLAQQYAASHVGTVREVLFEKRSGAYITGHTDTYLSVRVKNASAGEGEFGRILVTSASAGTLEGNML